MPNAIYRTTRIRSYRNNFAKHSAGPRKGKYVRLDFAMLVDLATIDMYLRDELLKLALDIEHFSKLMLLREIERHGEDGYAVVSDFVADQELRGHSVEQDFKQGEKSAYISGLMSIV